MDLFLPMRREYFEQVKAGTKKDEYRLVNNYWRNRIEGKTFDRVILTLGYPRSDDNDRRFVLPYRGYVIMQITHPYFGTEPVNVFAFNVTQNSNI
jgi:hypothetical protein